MKSIRDWSLKSKIILHVLVIGFLAAILLTFLFIKTQKNIIHSMSQQKAELVNDMIENSLFSSMKEGRVEKVQAIIQEIARSEDIKKIRILSPQGKILRSSYKDEIGKAVETQTRSHINLLLSRKDQPDIFFIAPKSMVQGFRAIKNSRECIGCHSPQEKVNGILEVNIDFAPSASLLQKNQLKGIIIGVIALATLTFIIIRLFEKLINQPLIRLKDRMKKAQKGDLDIQLYPLKNDEIGSLTQHFNLMVRKLKEANQEIERLFNKQMEKAEHLASIGELAAGLAHEIKNPIAGMKGALEIIHQKTPSSDPKKEIFSEMLLQLEKINRIIQDLLSYARPKEMNLRLIDPNRCIENAINLAKTQTNEKDIQIHFKRLKNGTLAHMDEDKIQEVMLNLMLNSISAIREKGRITIELHENRKKNLEIVFSDDGEGIKKENIPRIFDPFFTTRKRGTGLGLSICKKIIEAHNGSVDVQSVEGQGTTFLIRLPVLNPPE
ncbi:MAG: ATP-binding protein [Candidatus Aminicenantales bacterium]